MMKLKKLTLKILKFFNKQKPQRLVSTKEAKEIYRDKSKNELIRIIIMLTQENTILKMKKSKKIQGFSYDKKWTDEASTKSL